MFSDVECLKKPCKRPIDVKVPYDGAHTKQGSVVSTVSYVAYRNSVQGLQTNKSGIRKQVCASRPVIAILFPTIDYIW